MVDILVPKARLRVPRKQVYPSNGDLVLRCQNCGSMSFRGHVAVAPETPHRGKLSELVCQQCGRVIKLEPDGHLDGRGEVTVEQRGNGSNH